ncbi:MAG: MBL fold metallo-hydrolase [Sphingomonadales bacterium]|jgi:glyoxylase-like metal-dependent hydrolase (beta-lactamase superfamily II)
MALKFISDPDSQSGKCYHPHQGLRRVVAPNAGPFTYTGTGTYILGENDVAVIDPGPDNPAHLDALMNAIGDARISHIIVTHTHRDHSPLSQALKKLSGAPIWGCPPLAPHGDGDHFEEALDDSYKPDRILKDGDIVEGNSWTLKAIATPGHVSNHFCYHWLEENALFCGDHVMSWSTSVILPPDGDMADYLTSLEKIKAMDVSTLWPTHGQPITEVKPFLSALIQHRMDRESAILATLNEGESAIMPIVEKLYIDTPKALYPAAARSVFAHLIKLKKEGRVDCHGDASLDAVYFACTTNS